uniref:Peptidase S1 domain-containing protein n=1 Tax=Trichuris muris TaxID=70415 RepID=A0A5S6R3D9_TRIMR
MNSFRLIITASLITTALAVECGDVSYTKLTATDRGKNVNGRKLNIPWRVVLQRKGIPIPWCLGSLIQYDQYTTKSNHSSLVLTATGCFRNRLLKSYSKLNRFQAYVGVTTYNPFRTDGKCYDLKGVSFHSEQHGKSQIKRGIAILTLSKPVPFSSTVRPVCLPPSGQKPPLDSTCFLSVYYTLTSRMDEADAPLIFGASCGHFNKKLNGAKGYCTYYPPTQSVTTMGSPLMCIVGEKVYQYGVYTVEFRHRVPGRDQRNKLGFFNTVHTVSRLIIEKLPDDVTEPSDKPSYGTKSGSSASSAAYRSPEVTYRSDEELPANTQSSSSSSSEADEKPLPVSEQTPQPDVEVSSESESPSAEVSLGNKVPSMDVLYPANAASESNDSHAHVGDRHEGHPLSESVHIVSVSDKIPKVICTGSLYAPPHANFTRTVVTSASCVWSRVVSNFMVYMGSKKSFAEGGHGKWLSIYLIATKPILAHHSNLKMMGVGVIKLQKPVALKKGTGFQMADMLDYATANSQCFVAGVCEHGLSATAAAKILEMAECRSRLRQNFYPNVEYCAAIRKDALMKVTGAALVCLSGSHWIQYGIYDSSPGDAHTDGLSNDKNKTFEIGVFMKVQGGLRFVKRKEADEVLGRYNE